MTIQQTVAGRQVVFTRNWFSGLMTLSVDGAECTLQSPLNFGTHFSLNLKDAWLTHVGECALLIERIRPLWFAGLRPQTYRLLVDGELVAERHGY